jgi:hypothetical protein
MNKVSLTSTTCLVIFLQDYIDYDPCKYYQYARIHIQDKKQTSHMETIHIVDALYRKIVNTSPYRET